MTLLEHIADCAKTVTAWEDLPEDEQSDLESKEFKPYKAKIFVMLFDEMIGKDDFEYFMSKNCEISDLLEEFEALPDTEREKYLPFLRTAVEIRLRDELHDVSLEALTKLQAIV